MGNQIINADINVIGKVKEQGTPILDNIAPEYDATATYHVGDICMHEGKLYSCNTVVSTAAWDSSKWTETNFATLRNESKADIDSRVKWLQITIDEFGSDLPVTVQLTNEQSETIVNEDVNAIIVYDPTSVNYYTFEKTFHWVEEGDIYFLCRMHLNDSYDKAYIAYLQGSYLTISEADVAPTKENVSNKVMSLSNKSTNLQYPSAKCVYEKINDLRLSTPSSVCLDDSLGLYLGYPERNVTRSMIIGEELAQELKSAEILILNYDTEDDDIFVLQGRYSINSDTYTWTGTIRNGNDIDILDAWVERNIDDDIIFYLRERQMALKNDVCLYQHSVNVTVESGYSTTFKFVNSHSSAYTSYSDIWSKTPTTFMISLKGVGYETGKYVYLASNGMYLYDALGQAPLSQTAPANVEFTDTVTQIF